MKASKAVLAASVAGLLAAVGAAGTNPAQAAEGDKVPCYGVNKCQGTGACGGKGHSCHGQNACAGQGYLEIDKDTCLKIKDGRLTAELEAPAADKKS
jgi:uncharacterized membrane protein